MPHMLPSSANETISEQTGDYFLSVTATERRAALTGRDDLSLTRMIDPLFSFLLSMIGSRRRFFFTSFQYFVFMVELVLCK